MSKLFEMLKESFEGRKYVIAEDEQTDGVEITTPL